MGEPQLLLAVQQRGQQLLRQRMATACRCLRGCRRASSRPAPPRPSKALPPPQCPAASALLTRSRVRERRYHGSFTGTFCHAASQCALMLQCIESHLLKGYSSYCRRQWNLAASSIFHGGRRPTCRLLSGWGLPLCPFVNMFKRMPSAPLCSFLFGPFLSLDTTHIGRLNPLCCTWCAGRRRGGVPFSRAGGAAQQRDRCRRACCS